MNNSKKIPKHVAIIPDGNRRWAKKRKLPYYEGHKYSAEKILPKLIEKAADLGITYFTFWTFSTENIRKRTKEEVRQLFVLMRLFLKQNIKKLHNKGVQVRTIGDLKKLPTDIREGIENAIKKTKHNQKIVVIFAINYGGKDEIIRAIRKIFARFNRDSIYNLNEEEFGKFLDTSGIPDPDLIIRTGGEKRLSGFLPWQNTYSELYFTDAYFPDFTIDKFEGALKDYSLRQRRLGR